MAGQKNYVYSAIARSVVDHGINTMFGLMGDANLFMVDDYVRRCNGTFVPVAFEGSAVLMALAYSKFAQTIGVATVTHGPGFTNCITALTEGVRGNTSMVLLCGDTPVLNPQNLQNIDQRELAKASGAGFEQMRAPETVCEDVAKAFYRASVEKKPLF
jgi:acetolactate synthase-1/2/3 large subunit